MLRLVTVCRPAKAFNFYSGHPDVCAAIIIIIIKVIINASNISLDAFTKTKISTNQSTFNVIPEIPDGDKTV